MSWPRRVSSPVRVISRRLVTVYVVVSQLRNGRTTNQSTKSSATAHTTSSSTSRASPLGSVLRYPATAATRISTSAGTSSALTWVRVERTTTSSSFSSFREIATDRSCHLHGPHVHDVPGAQHSRPGPRAHLQPAVRVDAGGLAGDLLAGRQVHPNLAPERRAAAHVGLEQSPSRVAELCLPL